MLFYIDLDNNARPKAVSFRRLEAWLQLHRNPDTEFEVKEWAREAKCRSVCPVHDVDIRAVAPTCHSLDTWQWDTITKDMPDEERQDYAFWRNSFIEAVNLTCEMHGKPQNPQWPVLAKAFLYLHKYYDLPTCTESEETP
jgi:hypothetical protein